MYIDFEQESKYGVSVQIEPDCLSLFLVTSGHV